MSYHRLDEQRHGSIQYAPAPYAPGYVHVHVQPPRLTQQHVQHVPLYPVLTPQHTETETPTPTPTPTPTAPTEAAVPIQAAPTIPQPSVAVPPPFAGSHIEPAYMSFLHRFLLSCCYTLLCVIFGLNLYLYLWGDHSQMTENQDKTQIFLLAYCGIVMILLPILLALKLPTRLEFTPNCVILHTRLTSHSIAYERITSVEMLPSVCCWFGSGCTFPKGGFTAFSAGLFIRSADCGQSIAFTPTDINRIAAHIRTTPAANRLVQS